MDPNFFLGATWLFKAYLEKGMYSQALAVIEAEKGYVPKSLYLTDLAGVRAKMGEKEAYAARSNSLSSLKVWPACDPVRGDPRFIELERRVKLIP